MQPEAKNEVGLPPVQDSTENETQLDYVDEGFVKDAGPAAFANRVFLMGSEMAIGIVRKKPFFC